MRHIISSKLTILLLIIAISLNTSAQISDSEDLRPDVQCSGTLPILHINVYDEDNQLDNDILSRNLGHKEFFEGTYWLEDYNGMAIGSEDEPLNLEIKARGNFTRKAYSKKPFKLKLGKKQELLGLSKSKHFALLAHADDQSSYLRNFSAFNLGHRIGLPWTPSQVPVEVVINGDYRGLYFLTESIRVSDNRVNIEESEDNATNPDLITGGYIVEMDNYIEENQFFIKEKSCIDETLNRSIAITVKSPDVCSDEQFEFLQQQFDAMNDAIGECSNDLWAYLDMDDAARYYLVMEIISHLEAYGGSTYLFRDRGEDKKWHYSPLWDCGHAFEGSTDCFFYNSGSFANRWIPSICANQSFCEKVKATWMWLMSSCFDGFYTDVDNYISEISEAAITDRMRWKDVPSPDGYEAFKVADNSEILSGKQRVVKFLEERFTWLKDQFGDYTLLDTPAEEPLRDTTPAAPLPSSIVEYDNIYDVATYDVATYDLLGRRVLNPKRGMIYLRNGRKFVAE